MLECSYASATTEQRLLECIVVLLLRLWFVLDITALYKFVFDLIIIIIILKVTIQVTPSPTVAGAQISVS